MIADISLSTVVPNEVIRLEAAVADTEGVFIAFGGVGGFDTGGIFDKCSTCWEGVG